MTVATEQKRNGVYYTPEYVANTLVRWAVRKRSDRLLDPSCGDGRFLAVHENSFGVDQDSGGVVSATRRAPKAWIHIGDFFAWAAETTARFECAAGNPPFIRYQRFAGEQRANALRLCQKLGVKFSALSSSWAPFLAATASLLKPGGRMAFVIPAEVGHAPYAAPLIEFLARRFDKIQLVAIRDKLFPELSEDVWLLFADGYGGSTSSILLTKRTRFKDLDFPPNKGTSVALDEWKKRRRLRPFLLAPKLRSLYQALCDEADTVRLGEIARVGIGYVTGANDFFHLRPTQAKLLGIPEDFLLPTVRNARFLPARTVTPATVRGWIHQDKPVLLLRLNANDQLPSSVAEYLESPGGRRARTSYKCRNRTPWYAVPDVRIPDAFLSYMSGEGAQLVGNTGRCSCTNSIHAVEFTSPVNLDSLQKKWQHPVARLSCEVEGHPLGGGMLKLEPREAARIILPRTSLSIRRSELALIEEGFQDMRKWRHYG